MHWSTHPPTHPWVINLQTELNYLDWVNIFKISNDLTWTINSPFHPPTYRTIHPPMGGGFSIDFKSLNRIKLSWLVQVLSNFYLFRGPPLGGWWVGVLGWGWIWMCGGVPSMHTCMHMHIHACMHTCMHAHPCCKHDKHGCLHVSGHLQISIHVYMHLCACGCMWGLPHAPRWPRHPPPTCPSPEPQGAQNTKISISLELIEIIQFCLKILYLWTLLNSYRL